MSISRRNFNATSLQAAWVAALVGTGFASLYPRASQAFDLSSLSRADASSGLKLALQRGAEIAISSLGTTDGFLKNALVMIPLPGFLKDAEGTLRMLGQGSRLDELHTSINRAAEAAVPMAKDLIVSTAKNISVTDAKNILSGGEGSVTKFFAEKTRLPLFDKFLPVVNTAVEKVGLVEKYNSLATRLQQFGVVKPEDANVQKYVTGKSLDGLFTMIGEEEKKIRRDPVGTGSAILSKVFGALGK